MALGTVSFNITMIFVVVFLGFLAFSQVDSRFPALDHENFVPEIHGEGRYQDYIAHLMTYAITGSILFGLIFIICLAIFWTVPMTTGKIISLIFVSIATTEILIISVDDR